MNLQEYIRRILREEEDKYDDKVGKTFWFEYHCYESPESCDAEIWYRSHQKVKVIGVSEWSYDDKEWRQEDGNPRVYLVQWEERTMRRLQCPPVCTCHLRELLAAHT
jgi:hypothetical protein